MTSKLRGTVEWGSGEVFYVTRWFSLHFCFKLIQMCTFLFSRSWLDSVSFSGRSWEISCGLKKQKVLWSYSLNKKKRTRNTHCFDTIPEAPHPSCHVLCTSSRPNNACPILIFWFYPCQAEGRCLLLFLSADWFYFHAGRMSVIEPKDGRRSCIWMVFFFIDFWFLQYYERETEKWVKKCLFCSHIETPSAVESHGWSSHLNQIRFQLSLNRVWCLIHPSFERNSPTLRHSVEGFM